MLAPGSPRRRWTAATLLSLALGIVALCLIVIGLSSRRAVPLLGGIAGLGASFAAISVGWALDYKLVRTTQNLRVRIMQWFFMLVALVFVISSVVNRAR